MVVTLETALEKLVIGAFLGTGPGSEWEYWEGEFGTSELEAHVRAWRLWRTCSLAFNTWIVDASIVGLLSGFSDLSLCIT